MVLKPPPMRLNFTPSRNRGRRGVVIGVVRGVVIGVVLEVVIGVVIGVIALIGVVVWS